MAQSTRQTEYSLIQIIENTADLAAIPGRNNIRTFTKDTGLFYYWSDDSTSWILEPGSSSSNNGSSTVEITMDITDATSITVPDVDIINLTSDNSSETINKIFGLTPNKKVKFQFQTGLNVTFSAASDLLNLQVGDIVMPSGSFVGTNPDWIIIEGFDSVAVRQADAMNYGVTITDLALLKINAIDGAPLDTNLPNDLFGVFKDNLTGLTNLWKNDGGSISLISSGGSQWVDIQGGISYTGNVFVEGNMVFGTSYVSKGTFDNSLGGNFGISLTCTIGYELNWQAGHLKVTADAGQTSSPLFIDNIFVVNTNEGVQTGFGIIQSFIQSSNSEAGLLFSNTGTNGRDWVLFSTNQNSGVGEGKFMISDATSGAPRFTIDANGFTGINNINPTVELDVTGSIKASGDIQATGVLSDLNGPVRNYKVYSALLNQTGTNDPVATILENGIGNIVWTRSSTGLYIGTLSASFPANKTAILTQTLVVGSPGQPTYILGILQRQTDNILRIDVFDPTNPVTNIYDGKLINTFIEIRVYN